MGPSAQSVKKIKENGIKWASGGLRHPSISWKYFEGDCSYMDTPRWLWLFTVQDVLQDKIVTQSEPKTLRKSNHCERWCLCTLFYFLIFFHSFWMTLYSMVISTPSDIGSQRHCLIFSLCAQFTKFWFLPPFGRFYYDCLISLQFGPSDHLTGVRKHLPNFDIFVENIIGVILDFSGKRTPGKFHSLELVLLILLQYSPKIKRIYIIELNIQHCTSFHSNWFGQIPRTIHVASPVGMFSFEDDYVWWSVQWWLWLPRFIYNRSCMYVCMYVFKMFLTS